MNWTVVLTTLLAIAALIAVASLFDGSSTALFIE
jgi:hypothetical protein